jgi:hypothetical protein
MERRPLLRSLNSQLTRRSAVAAGMVASIPAIGHTATRLQGDTSSVAAPIPGLNGFEFVGLVNQSGFSLEFLGYVTYVAGVDTNLLFTEADPTERGESNARILITGTATAVARSIVNGVFAVNAEGTVRFHLATEGGASFGTPEAFASDEVICSMSTRIHSTISVYAPQQGIASASGEAVIDSTLPFDLGAGSNVIGSVGQTYRYGHNGVGELLDPENLVSVVSISGYGAVAG